jgi:biotin carboxylase
LGVPILQVVDMPQSLAEHWRYELGVDYADVSASADRLLQRLGEQTLAAVLAVDDSGALLAAEIAARLGLPHNHPQAAQAARDKHLMRQMLQAGGVRSPWFLALPCHLSLEQIAQRVEEAGGFPCVVKPVDLNGSRGVIRANDLAELRHAVTRLLNLIGRSSAKRFLVEGYIPGVEVALEGMLDGGALRVLALFDKPDPLEGPFFEETLYVTPSRLPVATQEEIARTTAQAAQALGLHTGPIHAELRINEQGAWIVEIAGRSIGGLCSRTLRFGTDASLEELIVRQAAGLPLSSTEREAQAGGVMMIPIPGPGILRGVTGVEEAEALPGIESITITAHLDNPLVPLPEGESYLGFIFARGQTPEAVEAALRQAHARLHFVIEEEIRLTAMSSE